DLVNQLDQGGLQHVIEQLRSTYVDPNALTTQEINQAAVEGLLLRLGPGALLQKKTDVAQPIPTRPFETDLIESKFGYVRLGSFDERLLPQLDQALNSFRDRGTAGLIVDLRTMPAGGDFQLAAQILSRFVPKGRLLFNLVEPKGGGTQSFRSSSDPIITGPVAVLVSQENAGIAEAIAGVLRNLVHALVIGQQTTGRTVEYARYDIGDQLVLTVAVKKLVIPEAPSIFPNGLAPDINVPFPKEQQDAVLALADQNGVNSYIFDEERPHTNEAALVAGKNPDLDAYEADHPNGQVRVQHPKDIVLQRAIDFLTAVSVLGPK
ncbi:MAG TPA: S41 family peptidase, partial [Chthoniobacterales bacterium]|nr:S41 family peptidase [Chthoniobacterales bacterium]